jgi:hypothetical protein
VETSLLIVFGAFMSLAVGGLAVAAVLHLIGKRLDRLDQLRREKGNAVP